MKRSLILSLSLLVLIISFGLSQVGASPNDEAGAIKELIEKSYVHGAFNALDPDAMRRGFHEDFAIYSAKGEDIGKYPIKDWAAGAAKRKADPEFDPAKNKWAHNFVSVDVTGKSAAVKLELSKDGKLVYTDYLSLLKFDSGWRIVAKVFHNHK